MLIQSQVILLMHSESSVVAPMGFIVKLPTLLLQGALFCIVSLEYSIPG